MGKGELIGCSSHLECSCLCDT